MSHRVGSTSCYWILTAKGQVIETTTVQNVTKDKASTNYFQRITGHYNKCLSEAFSQRDHCSRNLDGLEGFTNDDVPNPYNTYEEAYNGPNVMLNVNEYVNNAED